MAMATQAWIDALDVLDFHWGQAYELAVTRAGWIAKRLDNQRALVAASPGELRGLIIGDYTTQPVAREVVSCSAQS